MEKMRFLVRDRSRNWSVILLLVKLKVPVSPIYTYYNHEHKQQFDIVVSKAAGKLHLSLISTKCKQFA